MTGNIPQYGDLDDHHIVPQSWGPANLGGRPPHESPSAVSYRIAAYSSQYDPAVSLGCKRKVHFETPPSKAKGGLGAENYSAITGTSSATATRDLQDLVEKGALGRKGELCYTRYPLNLAMEGVSTKDG